MSDVAIRVRGLSKQYHIGGQQTYDKLSDQLANMIMSPFRRAGKLLRGQATGAAGLDETIWAVKDVSLEIKHGEVVGIIGRNGAGKSTLLKILSRITEPTEGYADIYGRVGSLLEVGTGFHPELTGRENIYLNGAILGMRKAEIERKFDEIVAFAEIEKFIDTPVKHYSSGMYVRLAFSVAAHLEPEILLVDEVLAVGDVAFQRKCLGKMDEVSQQGRTVLFVSHNMAVMQTLCQRGVFLQNGTVSLDGTATEAVGTYLRTLEQNTQQDLAKRTDRRGKGQMKLVRVEVSDGIDQSSSIIAAGRPVRFTFHVNEVLPGTTVTFSIYNQHGQPITSFKSIELGPEDLHDPEIGSKFICELDELLLVPGRYRMNVSINNSGELQDHVEAPLIFDVEQGQLDGRPLTNRSRSSVYMRHRWILPV